MPDEYEALGRSVANIAMIPRPIAKRVINALTKQHGSRVESILPINY